MSTVIVVCIRGVNLGNPPLILEVLMKERRMGNPPSISALAFCPPPFEPRFTVPCVVAVR